MIKYLALAAMLGLSASAFATDERNAPLELAQPSAKFLATVSPIVARLKNVRYIDAGPNLIGVIGESPFATTEAEKTILMFFDESGEYLIAGQVTEWRKGRNVTAVALRQFAAGSPLAEEAGRVQKSEVEIEAKLKEAMLKDMATQRANLQQRNADAAKVVEGIIANGLPSVDIGRGPKRIVAFVDLTCRHCMSAIRDLVTFAEGAGNASHTVRLVLTANPKDGANANATAMIYGSSNPLSMLKATLGGQQKASPQAVQAGTAKLQQVQAAMQKLQLKVLPYFVMTTAGKTRMQTGYNSLQDLTK